MTLPSIAMRAPDVDRSALSRLTAAVRSQLRRYPRVVAEAMREASGASGCPVAGAALREALSDQERAVAWLGHGSVLARLGEATIAVDPVCSDRIGYRLGRRTIGPRRLIPAPVHAESLRGLDMVLITHAHFDHLDRPTLRHLAHPRTTLVVPRGCARLAPPGFGRVLEVRRGESARVDDLLIETLRPEHRGGRHWLDHHRKAHAYTVRHDAGRMLFAGDTAMTDAFDDLGDIDLAVFGIGAYNPRSHAHATPEEAWAMFRASGARHLLPVHHSTFHMSDEPVDEPMQRLLAAAGDETPRIIVAPAGEVRTIN